MNAAWQYCQGQKQWKVWMSQINKVRLNKKVYLPFELVGVDNGKPTNAYYNLSEESAIQWSFMMERENTKITNVEYKIW